jgi:hypothetical protein
MKYTAGITKSVSTVAVTIPPIMGAAMRFMTSAPVPCDHMMGSKPGMMADAVMILGRIIFSFNAFQKRFGRLRRLSLEWTCRPKPKHAECHH